MSTVKSINYKKDCLEKSNERTLVSRFAILAQNWSKIATQKKKKYFGVHPAVHTGVVKRGLWLLALVTWDR